MTLNTSPEFPRISTIDSVYRPVEEFHQRLGESSDGDEALAPLDAYLLHLILEFCPRPVLVADLACGRTSGTASVVCLSSKSVSQILGVTGAPTEPRRLRHLSDLLAEIAGNRPGSGKPRFAHLVEGESVHEMIRAELEPHELLLFLIDPASDSTPLGRDLDAILERYPEALILVLSVGKVGECETARVLAQSCRTGSPHRLWLLRETSGALLASQLAFVAGRADPVAPQIVLRLEQLFATNFDFLNLVHDSCMYAVEQANFERAVSQWEEQLRRLTGECQQLEQGPRRLGEENRRLGEENRRLGEENRRLDEENRRLEVQLQHECTRPLVKDVILRLGRRIVHFGRRHRATVAPHGSVRDRLARKLMASQRRLRGRTG
jgi:hypothetical protein